MINFTSIIQVLTEIKSSLVSQNGLPHWIEIYLVINLNSATSEQFLIQAMRQNQIQLCPFGQPSLESIQQNLQFKVGTKGFFCSEVILTLNSWLFFSCRRKRRKQKDYLWYLVHHGLHCQSPCHIWLQRKRHTSLSLLLPEGCSGKMYVKKKADQI